jgi:inorganic pyrophosphatase
MIDVKPIALFRMEDDKGVDDKVLCVPLQDPAWNHLEELDDLPDQLRQEIAHFFSVYKDLEQKKVKVDGWYGREDALTEIAAARERCAKHREGDGDHPDSLAEAEPVEQLSDSPAGPQG